MKVESHSSESQNAELLENFADYCAKHPDERFWQAMRNWSGNRFVLISESLPSSDWQDTFYSDKRSGR